MVKKLNYSEVMIRALKALFGAESALHGTTKLDLELTTGNLNTTKEELEHSKGKLSRAGQRSSRIPQEHKDIARKIADEEKEQQKNGYKKRAISRLKKEHGIEISSTQSLDNYIK